ncbi:GNAT family N-acetyltransferase [Sphaerisporangium sp. NPDC088356]|uniref:GNAT family N-acetyltransferase n=1 Tax=Sphaerisporangium sp. NPDC088356 TaxID=3154871 RepID=UPI00342D7200
MSVVLRTAASEGVAGLVLRPWAERDIPELIEAYRDPVMRRWTRLHVTGEQDARRWLEVQWAGWEGGERLSFAVFEPVGGSGELRLVGNVALKGLASGGSRAEVGYWTAAGARGRGVAARALERMTTWAFEAFGGDGLECLRLLHQVDNLASCRVAGKCGYALEGVLPAHPPFPLEGHVHARYAASVPTSVGPAGVPPGGEAG